MASIVIHSDHFYFPALGYDIIADIRQSDQGSNVLYYNGFLFHKTRVTAQSVFWSCTKRCTRYKCKATAVTKVFNGDVMMKLMFGDHTHDAGE